MNLRRSRHLAVTLILLLLIALPTTAWAASLEQGTPPPTADHEDTLENLTYISDFTESGEVELDDGQFEDADNLIFVTIANSPRAFGDVDGDGLEDAVVWLATNTGGSGVFVDLAVVTDVGGDATNAAVTLLGDRTQVRAIEIDEDGAIIVEVVTQGPEDPFCCPTQIMRLTYILDGNVLALAVEQILGTVGDEATDPVTDDSGSSDVLTDTVEIPDEVTETPADQEGLPAVVVEENPFDDGVLENATYLSEYTDDGEVTLVDGAFEDATNRIRVELLDAPRLYGDVDGDGVADALVLLYSNTGGSGGFIDLAVVLNQDGVAFNADSDLLGDRVDVQSINLATRGEIIVRMVTQGPDEPMCCGTLLVDRVYAFADETLTLVEEIDIVAAAAAAAEALAATPPSELGGFTPVAAPIAASLAIDSANPLAPDPALVTVIAGPGELFAVDALPLGENCAGWIPPAPSVSLQWNGTDDRLNFFTLGAGDPTLLVLTPDGSILCNDDVATEVFNPLVTVTDPQPGRYAIFVGIYDPSLAPATSLLVITSRDLDPTNYSVALPALSAEASDGLTATVSAGATGSLTPEAGPEAVVIASADLPFATELTGGGPLSVFEEDLGNPLCRGFATTAPTFRFALAADDLPDALVVFNESAVDTTLVILDPTGVLNCIDDNADYTNLNPRLELTPLAGDYDVWIGTYSANTDAPGTLTITSDLSALPEVLVE